MSTIPAFFTLKQFEKVAEIFKRNFEDLQNYAITLDAGNFPLLKKALPKLIASMKFHNFTAIAI